MNCRICNADTVDEILWDKIKDYTWDKSISIYTCTQCGSHQINDASIDFSIYDKIYEQADKIEGYDRYYMYAHHIKASDNKLQYLANREPVSYFVVSSLSKLWIKQGAKILEIGCGFWYLTYALNEAGYDCTWIDVSHKALSFAFENFGNYYVQWNADDLEELWLPWWYDVIITTELIEHIMSPYTLILTSQKLLRKWWYLICSTPNKNFSPDDALRVGDLPPVHVTRLTKQWFLNVSHALWFSCDFFNFCTWYMPKSCFKKYTSMRNVKKTSPHMHIVKKKKTWMKYITHMIGKLFDVQPIRGITNIITWFLTDKEYIDMGVIMKSE